MSARAFALEIVLLAGAAVAQSSASPPAAHAAALEAVRQFPEPLLLCRPLNRLNDDRRQTVGVQIGPIATAQREKTAPRWRLCF
jgi:hypothetical protein